MAKHTRTQNSFNMGELGPELRGRSDLKEYYQGAKRIGNFLPRIEGSLSRRPGFKFIYSFDVVTTGDYAVNERLLVKEFLDSKYIVRFYTASNVSIVDGTSQVMLYEFDDSLDAVGSLIGSVELRLPGNEKIEVDEIATLDIGDGFLTFSTKGELPPTFIKLLRQTPTVVELDSFTMCPSENLLPPIAADDVELYKKICRSIPFASFNVDPDESVTVATSGTTGQFYITKDNDNLWENKYLRIRSLTYDHVFKLISWDETNTRYTAVCMNPMSAVGGINTSLLATLDNFAVSQWGGVDGYPRCAAYWQQRLVLGGAYGSYGDSVWFSQTGDIFQVVKKRFLDNDSTDYVYVDYIDDSLDSDAHDLALGVADRDYVSWISTQSELTAGTTKTEFKIYSTDGLYSSSSTGSSKQTGHGGVTVNPVVIDGSSLFVSADGRSIREFLYNDSRQSYITRNLNYFNPRLFLNYTNLTSRLYQSQIKEMLFQGDRNILWCLSSEGLLFGSAVDIIGGTTGWFTVDTEIAINSMNVLANTRGYMELFIGEQGQLFRMGNDYVRSTYDNPESSYIEDYPVYLDRSVVSYISATSDAATSWTGFDHFSDGEEITYFTDQGYIGTAEVSSGAIETQAAHYIVAGVPYKSQLITLPPDVPTNAGNTIGRLQKISKVDVFVNKSEGFSAGATDGQLYDVTLPESLYTGVHEFEISNSIQRDLGIVIETSSPLPLEITSLTIHGDIE